MSHYALQCRHQTTNFLQFSLPVSMFRCYLLQKLDLEYDLKVFNCITLNHHFLKNDMRWYRTVFKFKISKENYKTEKKLYNFTIQFMLFIMRIYGSLIFINTLNHHVHKRGVVKIFYISFKFCYSIFVVWTCMRK